MGHDGLVVKELKILLNSLPLIGYDYARFVPPILFWRKIDNEEE